MKETIQRLRFLHANAQNIEMTDEALILNLRDILECENNAEILGVILHQFENGAKLAGARAALDVFHCELNKVQNALT